MMLYLAVKANDEITVRIPVEDEEIGLVSRIIRVLKPGEGYSPWTYDELKSLGTGEHEVTFDDDGNVQNIKSSKSLPA
jgi:hypothetical protein